MLMSIKINYETTNFLRLPISSNEEGIVPFQHNTDESEQAFTSLNHLKPRGYQNQPPCPFHLVLTCPFLATSEIFFKHVFDKR